MKRNPARRRSLPLVIFKALRIGDHGPAGNTPYEIADCGVIITSLYDARFLDNPAIPNHSYRYH